MAELTFDQLSPEEKEAVVSFYNSQGMDTGAPITEATLPPARQTLSPPPVTATSLDTGEPVGPPNRSWRDMVVATEVSPTRGIMTDGPDMDEVQAFQERNGLPRDGVLDENTFRAMSAQALGQTQAPDGPPVVKEDPTQPAQSVIKLEDDETMKAYSAATSAGRRSLQDIEGIVLHHTHGSRHSTVEQYMRVGLDREVGAPFFIDVEGVVHQVAPLEEIIQHTSGTRSTVGEYRTPRGARYSSGNTIGIEIDATWDYNRNELREGPNEAQKIALNSLVNELLPQLNATRGPDNQLNIENSVFAHPELQAKMEDEATGVLNWLRVNNGFNEMRAIDREGNVQLSPRPQARQGN